MHERVQESCDHMTHIWPIHLRIRPIAMASGLKKKPEKKQEGSLPITFSMTSTYTYDPLIEIYTLV